MRVLVVVLSVTTATLAGATTILPPSLQALDAPAALKQVRYHRSSPEVQNHPERFYRIVSQGAYRGDGCLQLNSFGEHHSMAIFEGHDIPAKKGERYCASAYVRAPVPTQVAIFVWMFDEEDRPVTNIRGVFEVGDEWRQIHCEGVLTDDARHSGVLIRINSNDPNATRTIYIDELKLEKAAEPSPSLASTKAQKQATATTIDHRIPRLLESPRVDGKLDDAIWQSALRVGDFTLNNKAGDRPPQETRVWLGYDDSHLHVAAWCEEAAPARLTNHSKVRDKPDWSDDRIEFFISALAIPRMPTFYLSINAFGVTADQGLGLGPWDPELNLAVHRGDDGWSVEFSLPLASMGKHQVAGELWRMNIGRHHRASHTASSQLARFEGSFNEPRNFETFLFAPSAGQSVAVTCLTRGEMTPFGSVAGSSRVAYEFQNNGKKVEAVALTVESVVGDERRVATRVVQAAPGLSRASQEYTLQGQAGEVLTFRANLGSVTGEELFRSRNEVDKLQSFRAVAVRQDGLFESLLDRDAKWNPRLRGHLTWGQPIGGKEYYSALQVGFAHSYTDARRELSDAAVHPFLHWFAPSKHVDPDWRDRFAARSNPGFERAVADARELGQSGPALHLAYHVIGVDAEGNKGVTLATGFGFLPDPINRRAYVDSARVAAERFGDVIWAVCVGDEMTARILYGSLRWFNNNPDRSKAPSYMLEIDREVRERYGFGKYGIPWGIPQSDPSWPYCRRAYTSWLLDEIEAINKEAAGAVHALRPDIPFISEDTHGGGELSAESWSAYASIGTLQLQHNWQHAYSYGTKRARDLSGLDTIIPVPHDCDAGFPEGKLQEDELRELYSQIFRGGGSGFHFWPASFGDKEPAPPRTASVRSGYPFAWRVMLEMARQTVNMPPLRRPAKARAALFVSRESTKAGQHTDARLKELYTLLGPELRGWFEFVSDTQLASGARDLNDYGVVYVTEAPYADSATLERLNAFCRNGGLLVCADPSAFQYNIDGSSLNGQRGQLFGVDVGAPMKGVKTIFRGARALPVDLDLEQAHKLTLHDGARVLAKFDNQQPAIVEQTIGKGRTLFFAWSPLNHRAIGVLAWRNLLQETYVDGGGKLGHDIWRFMFPPTKLPPPEIIQQGRCLTGNYAFFHYHRMVEASARNVGATGTFTITTAGGSHAEQHFGRGTLSDRLKLLREPHLAIGSLGYGGYLKFQAKDWVELFAAEEGDIQIEANFEQVEFVDEVVVYCHGKLERVAVEIAGAEGWEVVAATAEPLHTGFQEVAKLRLRLKSPRSTNRLRLRFERPEASPGELGIVELELWAGRGEAQSASLR